MLSLLEVMAARRVMVNKKAFAQDESSENHGWTFDGKSKWLRLLPKQRDLGGSVASIRAPHRKQELFDREATLSLTNEKTIALLDLVGACIYRCCNLLFSLDLRAASDNKINFTLDEGIGMIVIWENTTLYLGTSW